MIDLMARTEKAELLGGKSDEHNRPGGFVWQPAEAAS
jgi:hypothetical protein